MRIAKELIGKDVVNSDATIVGKVVDLDIDFDKDIINNFSLIVSKKGIQETLNIKKGELVIPWGFVKTIGDKLILDYSLEKKPVKVDEDNDDEYYDLDLDKFEEELKDLRSRA